MSDLENLNERLMEFSCSGGSEQARFGAVMGGKFVARMILVEAAKKVFVSANGSEVNNVIFLSDLKAIVKEILNEK